jgi:hypothetical protein
MFIFLDPHFEAQKAITQIIIFFKLQYFSNGIYHYQANLIFKSKTGNILIIHIKKLSNK